MIDSHCHLDLPEFTHDWQQVLARCVDLGVTKCLIPGTTLAGWQRQLDLANRSAMLDLAFGLHPYFLTENWRQEMSQLDAMLANHKPVALGEIGLDTQISVDYSNQLLCFEHQLAIAANARLPVIIHHRKSHNDIIRLLKKNRFQHGGVIHAFSGSEAIARTYLDLGFTLGVGGTITYERGKKTRHAIAAMPMEALLLETDSPSMPVCHKQGQRNEPCFLPLIAEALAQLKNISVAEVASLTDRNYGRVFATAS
jgi:TatD DNase family protein